MRLIINIRDPFKNITPGHQLVLTAWLAAAEERRCGGGGGHVRMKPRIRIPGLTASRLEEAQDPESLAQETIIDNMSTEESKRISKVRNIGIAVCDLHIVGKPCKVQNADHIHRRHILIPERRQPPNESSSTLAE